MGALKPRTVIILVGVVFFLVAVGLALVREVDREEAKLARSISGVVEVSEAMLNTGQADIRRTDRLALLLIDPETGEAMALKTVSPFIPPQAVDIGQQDARGGVELKGSYYLMGITDKDGDLAAPKQGEVFGRSPQPIALGKEKVHLLLDQPFRGQMPPLAPAQPSQSQHRPAVAPHRVSPLMAANSNPCQGGATVIEGQVRAPDGFQSAKGQWLVIRILVPDDPAMDRAFVYREFTLPFAFRVGPSTNMSGMPPRKAYVVQAEVRSSGDGNSEGWIQWMVRTGRLVPLGTKGLSLTLKPAAP